MRNTLLFLLQFICLLFFPGSVFSQNDEKSTLIGNAGDRETANTLCADAAGNKYIGGKSNEKGVVIKQDASNVILWSKTLDYTSNPLHQVSIGFLDVIGKLPILFVRTQQETNTLAANQMKRGWSLSRMRPM